MSPQPCNPSIEWVPLGGMRARVCLRVEITAYPGFPALTQTLKPPQYLIDKASVPCTLTRHRGGKKSI